MYIVFKYFFVSNFVPSHRRRAVDRRGYQPDQVSSRLGRVTLRAGTKTYKPQFSTMHDVGSNLTFYS
jgi:hypothetical protein